MDYNNFTIKAQEAIQQSLTIAKGFMHQAVETGHLLKGVVTQSEDTMNYLLNKMEISESDFYRVLDQIIQSYPKVSGGEQYFSTAANKALSRAFDFSKESGDQFVSLEALVLGVLMAGDTGSKR